jgi:DMSO/TMAO reductase YedYZ heme-binding membrane subunit
MTATEAKSVFERLDQLNEFERQPVGEDRLQPGGYFAGSFAGEHVAATEFVIGALFVTWGASAYDILVGLVLGNLLAVLSWTLVCAPIAVKTRLTLYWYLRKIAGPVVMVVYNVLNAVLYCILAGCMITVAASAIRIPFGVEPQVGWLASDPWFYPIVIGVGAVVVTLAILGFKRLAQFASVCSPWMFLMFVCGAIVLLPSLGHVGSFAGFWRTANTSVWSGPPPYQSVEIQAGQVVIRFDPAQGKLTTAEGKEAGPFFISGGDRGQEKFAPAQATIQGETIVVSGGGVARPVAVRYGSPSAVDGAVLWQRADGTLVPVPPFRTYLARREDVIGFWHIVAFAWVCNLAMHLGLSDMALFRYARRASYGLYSAFGMYLGHYLAWICAGVRGAAVAGVAMLDRPLTGLDSGEVAFQALGAMGALAVVLACLAPLTSLVWRAANAALGTNPIEAVTHETGDWTLRLLLVSLAVTPLRQATGWNVIIGHRRTIGLFAFFYGSLHLVTYLWFDQFFDWTEIARDLVTRPFITLGMAALLLLVPLAATSTGAMIRRLGGRAWRRLHRLVYVATGLGLAHYWWLVKADTSGPLAYVLVFGLLMTWRVVAAVRRRLARTVRRPPQPADGRPPTIDAPS